MEKAEKGASWVKYPMNRKTKIIIIVVAMLALSLLSAFWATVNLSKPPPGVSRFPIVRPQLAQVSMVRHLSDS